MKQVHLAASFRTISHLNMYRKQQLSGGHGTTATIPYILPCNYNWGIPVSNRLDESIRSTQQAFCSVKTRSKPRNKSFYWALMLMGFSPTWSFKLGRNNKHQCYVFFYGRPQAKVSFYRGLPCSLKKILMQTTSAPPHWEKLLFAVTWHCSSLTYSCVIICSAVNRLS
jgi:hypothetical protein